MLRPQVFHSTYYTLPYWSGLRSVVTVHDFIHEKFPALLGGNAHQFIEQKRNVIESADAIVAVSQSTKDEILAHTKAEESKIVVIYHGVNDAFLTASPSEADIRMFRETHKIDGPYWLYVGNRGLYKNFGTLLRAFVRVARETGGYLVAVGGGAKLEPWQVDLLIKNRLEQRVHLLQVMDDDDLEAAYAGAMAFVFPSLAEGFGIPLLEAMAVGTPIVASDVPVFREVAGEAALFFDPYDEKGLATAMIKILDESVRGNLMEKGRKRVREFSWDTAASKLGDVYKGLV
jgi:glycosyltransferase involved in cell wall biosynthesis